MTFPEAVAGTKAPAAILEKLCLADVSYLAFDGCLHQGQLVVHEDVREDILEIFAVIEAVRFPVARAIPLVRYDWSDDASMADNNTSAFNYRCIAGTSRLSAHAWGTALDINPQSNPVIYEDGRIAPPGAFYQPGGRGVLTAGHPVVEALTKRGWRWGGFFSAFKDYHHFEKKIGED